MKRDYALDCGWGRLLFAQTFDDTKTLAAATRAEGPDRRDIVLYVRDPHVALAAAPQELFLDPSHTYRLDLSIYRPASDPARGFSIRRLTSLEDAEAINRIYQTRNMVPVPPDFFWAKRDARAITYFVAEDEATGSVIGTVTGVDHFRAFGDPEHGSSLWCLAVDPQAAQPGIGEALVRRLAEHFKARGSAYLDLSVLYDNEQAIALYEKLGFVRVPLFALKRRNPINEKLFVGPAVDEDAQPLRGDHRQRGAPARHRGRGDRRRGRLLPPDLWRALGALPREPVGVHLRRRHVDLRRQGGDAARGERRRRCRARADRGRRRRPRGVPEEARLGRGQAGARRTGPRRRRRPRHHEGGRSGDRGRARASPTACWSSNAPAARTCGWWSSTSGWWRRRFAGRRRSSATASRRSPR